jgi:hypothetical protein
MLALPAAIEAVLRAEANVSMAGILVFLDLHWHGSYYYGTLLGLTDASGRVRLEREQLLREFTESQRSFPMDYKVPLEECDTRIVVSVEGGSAFVARASSLISPIVSPAVQKLWRVARNSGLASTSASAQLDRPDPDNVVRVHLTVRPWEGRPGA